MTVALPGSERATRVVVRSAIAPLMSAPRVSAGQVSQLLRGHHAEILEHEGAWRRLLGADGYEGWCHAGYLDDDCAGDAPPVASSWASERRMAIKCSVREPDGGVRELPLGALLDADEEVVDGIAMNHRARARYFAPDGESIATRSVECFRGTPYQWGGVSPWGADCSGLVQTMFALHGTQLPRDAWMQGERGRELSVELADLLPADLLFFSDRDDGKVTHVALSLGGARVAHSSLANGGFGVNDLDASDAVASALRANFRFARRII